MEKIKDFFHDFSDVFFAIAVASVMFVVLSLNLGSWFNNSSNTVLADEPTHIIDSNLGAENNNKEVIGDKKEEIDENKEPENEDIDSNKVSAEETQNSDNINSNETQPDNPVTNLEVKTIVIPNGTPGSGVAKILKENGLIEETQDFIQTAENLNLAVRLKSGSFEIPANSTVEDMVKIIAGQKR